MRLSIFYSLISIFVYAIVYHNYRYKNYQTYRMCLLLMELQRPRGQVEMKIYNRSLILYLIQNNRPISRMQLAKMTGMSPTSMTRIVSELIDLNLVIEVDSVSVGVGRKATMLDINKDVFYSLGLTIDSNALELRLIDFENNIIGKINYALNGAKYDPATVASNSHDLFLTMIQDQKITKNKVKTLGVSIVGTVNPEEGVVIFSPQMKWKNIPLVKLLEEKFNLPVVLENDVKSAIYKAYTLNPNNQVRNLAYLNIGSGVGLAFMSKGKMIRGRNNAAGEIGHITVKPNGNLCDCGRKGCLNTYLAEKEILKKAKTYDQSIISLGQIVQSFHNNIPWANELIHEICTYLAIAINNTLCSYNPDKIIVGGPLVSNHPEVLEKALSLDGYFYDLISSDVIIQAASAHDEESVIGAALLAQSSHIKNIINQLE